MKISKPLVNELGTILKEEFDLRLTDQQVEKLAYTLVNFFSLLIKIEHREKFGNRPDQAIDAEKKEGLNENR